MLDSLSQDAAWPGNSLAQVHRTFVFDAIGRQIYDLQGRILLQHLSKMAHAVTSDTVTTDKQDEIKRKLSKRKDFKDETGN